MRKIVLLFVLMLLVANIAFAQEQSQPEMGFWAKLISWFKPKPVEQAPAVPQQGGESGGQVPPAETQTAPAVEEAPTEQAGQAVRKLTVAPAPSGVAPMPAVRPATPSIATDCFARECRVMICTNQQNQEVFCPQDANACNQRYPNRCRTVSCDTTQACQEMRHKCQKVTPQTAAGPGRVEDITCEGTYDYCRSVYSNCQCGVPQTPPTPSCTATSNRCTRTVMGTAVPTTSVEYVTCNDNYDNCVRQYGSCECGVPGQGTLPAPNYTQPTVNVGVEQCCCKIVAATNTNPMFRRMAKSECSTCTDDSYCPTIEGTQPTTATAATPTTTVVTTTSVAPVVRR